jgi:hypothetical protein
VATVPVDLFKLPTRTPAMLMRSRKTIDNANSAFKKFQPNRLIILDRRAHAELIDQNAKPYFPEVSHIQSHALANVAKGRLTISEMLYSPRQAIVELSRP